MIQSIPFSGPHPLQSLTLSDQFNHPLECVRLPDSLTYLDLICSYKHPIERMHLPLSLTRLDLGQDFRQPLRDWNPPDSLTDLYLTDEWDLGPSQLRLPPNLHTLTLPDHFNDEADEPLSQLHLPGRLHTLRLGGWMEGNALAALQLPHSLTALDLGENCSASLDDVVWPPHLTRLVTGYCFNQPLLDWSPPSLLIELSLGDENGEGEWNLPLTQLRLPSNLHKLTFGSCFDRPLTGLHFPASLRVLRFGRYFTGSLAVAAWTLPPMLEELHMGAVWNRPCTDLHLPPTLRKLTFSDHFNQPIENEQGECTLILPATLTELRFGSHFNQSLRCLRLPSSLRFLSIPSPDASYSVDELPASLPSRLQCLEVGSESLFYSRWAKHSQLWPNCKQCAVQYTHAN